MTTKSVYGQGATLLDGATADEFQIIVRDDLTALTNINVQVSGHLIKE